MRVSALPATSRCTGAYPSTCATWIAHWIAPEGEIDQRSAFTISRPGRVRRRAYKSTRQLGAEEADQHVRARVHM